MLNYVLVVLLWRLASGLRTTGTWRTSEERVKVVAKFGVQPFDPLAPELTRGFVVGNVTSSSGHSSDVALFIIPETRYASFVHTGIWELNCAALLSNISEVVYEPRCFNKGRRGDYMRWIPCEEGKVCVDEDRPSNVIKGAQFTFRIDEPYVPEYWYLILITCRLDKNCSWVQSDRTEPVNYDVTFLNGHPYHSSLLVQQFSFEQQAILEIEFLALVCFITLTVVQNRSHSRSRSHSVHPRSRILWWIIVIEVSRLSVQVFNMTIFAFSGSVYIIFSYLSELLRNVGVSMLCLLLLLLGSGWSLRKPSTNLRGYYVFRVWLVFTVVQLTAFTYDYLFFEEYRNYFDFVDSQLLPLFLVFRLTQGVWFLVEMKRTLRVEVSPERSLFLVHFGAAYLVWFSYYILLVAVSTVVSDFWRIKFVICVTTFSHFVAVACLVHMFWPQSSYRKFFSSDLTAHRSLSVGSSGADHDEYDLLIAAVLHSDEEDGPHTPFGVDTS